MWKRLWFVFPVACSYCSLSFSYLVFFQTSTHVPITQKQHKKCLMVSLNGIKLIIASYLENQANLMNKRMVCINNRKKYIKRKLILLLRKGLNVISTEYHCSQSNSSICGMLLDFKKKITLKAKGLGEWATTLYIVTFNKLWPLHVLLILGLMVCC